MRLARLPTFKETLERLKAHADETGDVVSSHSKATTGRIDEEITLQILGVSVLRMIV